MMGKIITQEEWNKLSDEEKFNIAFEDRFKGQKEFNIYHLIRVGYNSLATFHEDPIVEECEGYFSNYMTLKEYINNKMIYTCLGHKDGEITVFPIFKVKKIIVDKILKGEE